MDYSIIDAIYLKDISYLRLKSVILTYSLPRAWVKRVHMDRVSLNASLNNFLTLTAYDGMDPEVPGATYPTTRSASFGISIDF